MKILRVYLEACGEWVFKLTPLKVSNREVKFSRLIFEGSSRQTCHKTNSVRAAINASWKYLPKNNVLGLPNLSNDYGQELTQTTTLIQKNGQHLSVLWFCIIIWSKTSVN